MSAIIELTPDMELKALSWHQARVKAPVWFRSHGKLREGIVSAFGRKNLQILDLRNNETVARPFGEVFIRKVEGPPTLIAYRRAS